METLKHSFIWLNDEQWKSFLMDENGIQLSSKKHADSADMTSSIEKKSLISLTKTKFLPFNTIEKVSHLENGDVLTIHQEGKKVNLTFSDATVAQDVANEIADTRSFTCTQGSQSTVSALTPSLVGLAMTILFTFLINDMANDMAQGIPVDTSGRRAFVKQIMAWVAEALGSTGTLAVGTLLVGLCLYFMYKAYKNPANEFVYS
jgi:hypothetical protein